jgi:hypothetical protein
MAAACFTMQSSSKIFTFFSDTLGRQTGLFCSEFGLLWQMTFSFVSHGRYKPPGLVPFFKRVRSQSAFRAMTGGGASDAIKIRDFTRLAAPSQYTSKTVT